MNPPLTRRELLQRGAAGAAVLSLPGFLAACGGAEDTAATTAAAKELAERLRFSNWALYIDFDEKTKRRPTLDEFTRKTGVAVDYFEDINTNATYFAKIRRPLSQGRGIDRDIIVLTDNSRFPALLLHEGWLEKLDRSAIPNPGALLSGALRGRDGARGRRAAAVRARPVERLPRHAERDTALVSVPSGVPRGPRPRARGAGAGGRCRPSPPSQRVVRGPRLRLRGDRARGRRRRRALRRGSAGRQLASALQRGPRLHDARLARPPPSRGRCLQSGVSVLASALARSLGRREDAERLLALVETDAPLDEIFPVFGHSTAEAVAITRSMLHLARGDIDAALAEARRAESIDSDEQGIGKVVASFFLGVVFFFADDDRAAAPLLDRFLTDPRTAEQHARSYYGLALLAYIALDRGDVDEALRLAGQALERAQAHGLDEYPQTSFAHGALGCALLAKGDLDGAEEHLERAVALVRRGREGCDIALALLHLGLLRVRQGDPEAARDALASARSALEVAEPPRITRLDRELARELDSARKPHEPAGAAELTEAELRVLRMLPSELTYRQIAGRLFISMNTLKTHAMHIRRKLGVASRSEAVASARRRGLL
jgi:DNA-binding CsgD family transcriptional regulator